MNDIILSSLLNIFALVGSKTGLDKEKTQILITNYLKRLFSVSIPHSYVDLYSDLRDFYDEIPDLDKDGIIDGICEKLQGKVSISDKFSMVLHLMEFCNLEPEKFNSEDEILRKFARNCGVDDEDYALYADFVSGKASDAVLVIPFGEGTLKTLFRRKDNELLFAYEGPDTVLMNDVPVYNGISQEWQQSGVLKAKHHTPLYYSGIMSHYENTESANLVELCGRDVEFRFANAPDTGMHNFSFSLQSGQLVAIMGGSGVGKSTLLSLLNGTLKPCSGSITVNGHDISEPEAKALIGFVPQDDLLIEELTVYQNLWYTAKLCFSDMSDEEIDHKVISILSQLGLDAAKDLKVGSAINKYISGGQRKRLNIALELIREPAILFLDEPTSGLSSSDTETVINLLKEQTGKGKLIVTNIHQPSSDVYKLFDRLWILDKGGYPIFDGNPIEAVSYFKTAANYADAQTTTCRSCGNINPEIILNIVEEKALDNTGHITSQRKVAPAVWHSLYLKSRPQMPPVEQTDVPATDQKRPGFLRQTAIFLRRNISTKVTNLQYMLVTLLEAPVLAAICSFLTHYTPDNGVYSIMDNKNLPSYLFMSIIVAIFLGMSGSAEEIIRDRALLKREKFLNLSYGGYIWSKIIYMAGICLVQTLLFIIVGNLIMEIHGMFWLWWIILFVSAFLSSLIGLLLSQCLNSVVAIYITIPLLLIPQILLCGLVVDFEDLDPKSRNGNVPVIGDIIPSRWSYEALAVASFTMNDYEKDIFEMDCDKYSSLFYEHEYIKELESQLETAEFEKNNGREVKPEHLRIIHRGMEVLCSFYDFQPYTGDDSYDSILEYLESCRRKLKNFSNRTTLEIDAVRQEYAKAYGTDALRFLKRKNYNNRLEDLLLSRAAKETFVIVDDTIVPRCGHVFLTPLSRNGRAPFYSGVKVVGNTRIPTYWFNLCVLLIMCVLLTAGLLLDIPGKYVRKEKN